VILSASSLVIIPAASSPQSLGGCRGAWILSDCTVDGAVLVIYCTYISYKHRLSGWAAQQASRCRSSRENQSLAASLRSRSREVIQRGVGITPSAPVPQERLVQVDLYLDKGPATNKVEM
jgi:hypothetical protein